MTRAAPTAIDWRVGRTRTLLPAAVHSVALVATVDLAQQSAAVWILAGGVMLSAAADGARWFRNRRRLREVGPRTIVLIPGGLQIDTTTYQARCAWLGPGMTALWLKTANGRRRLLYLVAGELAPTDHAALRRHAKQLGLDP